MRLLIIVIFTCLWDLFVFALYREIISPGGTLDLLASLPNDEISPPVKSSHVTCFHLSLKTQIPETSIQRSEESSFHLSILCCDFILYNSFVNCWTKEGGLLKPTRIWITIKVSSYVWSWRTCPIAFWSKTHHTTYQRPK